MLAAVERRPASAIPQELDRWAIQARDNYELARLDEVEPYIGYLAYHFSWGDPMLIEDLMQESRMAVIKKLRADPDSPISHLKVEVRSTISNFRLRGKSVDGKLNLSQRKRRYIFSDLDQVVTKDGSSLREIIYDPDLPIRVTEEKAIRRVLIDQLRNHLLRGENAILLLQLWGVPWYEINRMIEEVETMDLEV